jgi:hypothetical protein
MADTQKKAAAASIEENTLEIIEINNVLLEKAASDRQRYATELALAQAEIPGTVAAMLKAGLLDLTEKDAADIELLKPVSVLKLLKFAAETVTDMTSKTGIPARQVGQNGSLNGATTTKAASVFSSVESRRAEFERRRSEEADRALGWGQ